MSKKQPSFSKLFEELESVAAFFESGEVDLESGIEKFERGMELALECKKRLAELENRVTQIREKFSAPETPAGIETLSDGPAPEIKDIPF